MISLMLPSKFLNSFISKYTQMLQSFHELVKGEKSARVRDNICAATARVLSAGHAQLPVQEVRSRASVCI